MLSNQTKEKIKAHIFAAEGISDAEFVCVVSANSVGYASRASIMACVCGFGVGFIFCLIPVVGKIALFEIMVAVFVIAQILFSKFPNLVRALMPKFLKFRLSYEYCVAKFSELGYANVGEAVAFFVCVNERYAHIITGKKIAQCVSDDEFKAIVDKFNPAKYGLDGEVEWAMSKICDIVSQKVEKTNDADEIAETLVEIK